MAAIALEEFMRLWNEAPPPVRAQAALVLRQRGTDPALQKPARLMSARAAAARLGLCVKSVLRLHAAGKLKGVRVTGSRKSLRFSEADVEALMGTGTTDV